MTGSPASARGGAGAGGQPDRQHDGLGVGVDGRVEQPVERRGVHAADGRGRVDHALGHHVDRDADGGGAGALGGPRLEQPQRALLDGELHVLHVAVVRLQPVGEGAELGVGLRQVVGHRGDGRGGAGARHHVLALRVQQVLAVEAGLAGRRVAGEGHAGARAPAPVAVHHRLHVDGRAAVLGDAVDAAVVDRAGVVPAPEDGRDGAAELLLGVLGERQPARLAGDDPLRVGDDLAELVGREVGVVAALGLRLGAVQDPLEEGGVDAQYDLAEHGHEATVGVVREPRVAGLADQRGDGRVVEAEVEHGIHHAGHRHRDAGADRQQEGVVGVAEAPARGGLDRPERVERLRPQALGEVLPVVAEGDAGLRGDRQAGGDGQAGGGHGRQPGALAPEEGLVARGGVVEGVHPAVGGVGVGHRSRREGDSHQTAAGRVVPVWGNVRQPRRARPSAADRVGQAPSASSENASSESSTTSASASSAAE